jgi:superfamily II DNA helicase RecQ
VLASLDAIAQARFAALKAWRAEVAREHNLPAYVIFHDATLAAIAARAPGSLEDLQGVSGIGVAKLELPLQAPGAVSATRGDVHPSGQRRILRASIAGIDFV